MAIEEEVRSLLLAGDAAGAATLAIRRLGPEVLRYLRALLRDEADAEEAFSQFAENLWRGLPGYEGRAAFRTWALRIAHHAALNLREKAWQKRGRRLETGEASRIAAEVRTASALRVERQHNALEALRASLSVEDQALLVLRVDQGLSWKEIAEVFEEGERPVPVAALTKRFERLKERLGRMAREKGLLS
ncbi:MAG TPA: sigma-70 family RNA polymerase sigma factor [Anaeromyxobacter sp.]|nr:sigma-70 family RNA polymerase sigma factor [Anaeromyxobacter sp.]